MTTFSSRPFVRGAIAALAAAATTPAGTALADWPQFRGADSNGVADETNAPVVWEFGQGDEASRNVAWTADVPGEGWSAPVIVGDRVFVTCAVPAEGDAYRFEVRAYGLANGELLWTRAAREAPPREPKHRTNTFATETPVADARHVIAYFGMNGLVAYTYDGEPAWELDLGNYPIRNDWGSASSLAIDSGRVFVQLDNESDSHVLALDAATGERLWRVERPDERSNWGSPMVWRNSLRTELVVGGATLRSYDPATGDELWSLSIGGRMSTTPSAFGDTLLVGSENRTRRGGTPGGMYAVRAGATGELDPTAAGEPGSPLAWGTTRYAHGISSPVVYDGRIYVPERRGSLLRVHDAESGELLFRKRLPGSATIWTSPWAYRGRVFVMNDRGAAAVLEPADELVVERTNELPGQFWSTPAVSDDTLVVRSATRLFALRVADGG